MPVTSVVVRNNCADGIIVRNDISDPKRAQTSCENLKDRSNLCASLAKGQEYTFEFDDPKTRQLLASAALSLSWDERGGLGTQLLCADYSFCQGIEIQGGDPRNPQRFEFGTSLNFDNQRGYSFPIGAQFQEKGPDGVWRRVCYDEAANSQTCAFDVAADCPPQHLVRVKDKLDPKSLSHAYCLSPDDNRSCMTRETAGTLNGDACRALGAQQLLELDLHSTVPTGNQTHSWCASRRDLENYLETFNAQSGHGNTREKTSLYLADKDMRETTYPGEGDAGPYQLSVDKACQQGVTNHFFGSLLGSSPLTPLTDPSKDRVPLPGQQGPLKTAISYECDGTNQYCLGDRRDCTYKADMAGNVGAKCPLIDQHRDRTYRIFIETCPA